MMQLDESATVQIMNIQRARFLFIVMMIWPAFIAASQGSHPLEQVEFSAEDSGVKRPVPIPMDVLAALRNDVIVQSVLEDQKIPAEKTPPSWFSASAIRLSGPDQVDLVVMGVGMRGYHMIEFWVFRATAHGHELVLNAPARDLRVENTRWHGYRDITFTSAMGEQIWCRFDGERYTKYKPTLKPVP